MKQLKFMLAAATAIGLATAAQAATTTSLNLFGDTEPVDTFEAGTQSALLTNYRYLSDDGENDSKVENGALTVSTGENPLLRPLDLQDGVAASVDMTATGFESLYIDTMVQFTVTPAGDDVEAKTDDKLMIYLAEFTNGVDGASAETPVTKLVVKAGNIKTQMSQWEVEETTYIVDNFTVAPNEWYQLVVTAKLGTRNQPHFEIKMKKSSDETFTNIASGTVASFPSLIKAEKTLTYVGFAGEGVVDNLTAVKLTVVNSVDFTFTWSDEMISAVSYTIGGGQPVEVKKNTAIKADPEQVLTLTITPAAWYKLASNEAITYPVPETAPEAAMSLNDYVKAVASTGDDGKVTVTAGTTAADLGIATGSAFDAADATVLGNLMTWAMSSTKGGSTSATAAATLVGEMTFNADNTPKSDAAKAYLLDCAISEVDEKKKDFKLQISFDSEGRPVVEGPTGVATYKNGNIVLQGREKLSEGNWAPKAEGHKFFKAVLTK